MKEDKTGSVDPIQTIINEKISNDQARNLYSCFRDVLDKLENRINQPRTNNPAIETEDGVRELFAWISNDLKLNDRRRQTVKDGHLDTFNRFFNSLDPETRLKFHLSAKIDAHFMSDDVKK